MDSFYNMMIEEIENLHSIGLATSDDVQEIVDIANRPASVFDTALYILNRLGTVTTMKLQKLCYYAQARSLSIFDAELFKEDFEAWAHGPVCRPLFMIHRRQRNISAENLERLGDVDSLSPQQCSIIDEVLNEFGDKEASFLEKQTHKEDPWIDARGDLPPGAKCSTLIPKGSIKQYYKSRIVAN